MGVTIYDVRNTLSSSATEVMSLCTDSSINPYSKHCPVDSSYISMPSETEWKSANYGFWIPEATTPAKIASYVQSGTIPSEWNTPSKTYDTPNYKVWKRKKPTGGKNSMYRLDDFYNYDHTAKEKGLFKMTFSGATETSSNKYTISEDGNFSITLSKDVATDYLYSCNDFNDINSCYLGIASVTHPGGLITTSDNTISSLQEIDFSPNGTLNVPMLVPTTGGTEELCLVASKVISRPLNGNNISNTTNSDSVCRILPFSSFTLTTTAATSDPTLTIESFSYKDSSYQMSYKITNNYSAGMLFNVYIYMGTNTSSLSLVETITDKDAKQGSSYSSTYTKSMSESSSGMYIMFKCYWNGKYFSSSESYTSPSK